MAPISWPSWGRRADEDAQETQVSSATSSAAESTVQASSIVEPAASPSTSAAVLETTSVPEVDSTQGATSTIVNATSKPVTVAQVSKTIPVVVSTGAPVEPKPVPSVPEANPPNAPVSNTPPSATTNLPAETVVSAQPAVSSAKPSITAVPSANPAPTILPSAPATEVAAPSSSPEVISDSGSKIPLETSSSVTLASSVSASGTEVLSTIASSSIASLSSTITTEPATQTRVALNLIGEALSSVESTTIISTSFSESVSSSGGVAVATSTIPVATVTRATAIPRSSTTITADPLSSNNKNDTVDSKMIMIGSVAGVVFLLASCLLVAFFLKRTRRRRVERDMEVLDFTPTAGPAILSTRDIEKLPRNDNHMSEKSTNVPSRGPSTKPRHPTLGPRPAARMAQLDLPNLTTVELPSAVMQREKAPSPVEVKRLSPPVSQDPFYAPTTSNGAHPTNSPTGRSTPNTVPPAQLNPFSDPDPFADPAVFPPSRLSTVSGTSQGAVSSSKYGFAV